MVRALDGGQLRLKGRRHCRIEGYGCAYRVNVTADGVMAVQPLGRQNMAFDQRMKRLQNSRTGADLVGQCRHAQINALPPVTLALPVQRLVLTELLEQDHGQQLRSGKAARRHMEPGRGRCALGGGQSRWSG
jgi:hypothetical protein